MTFLVSEEPGLIKKLRTVLGPVPTELSPALNANGKLRGDHDLNPASTPSRELPFIPAAVLVPIVLHDTGPTVILTRRATHLTKHAGQISFPGGRADGWLPDDLYYSHTILRDTCGWIGAAFF